MNDANGVKIDLSELTKEERKFYRNKCIKESKPLSVVIVEVLREKSLAITNSKGGSE